MGRIVRIVTHHKNRQLAAEIWRRDGLAAVGWRQVGDISRMSREKIVTELIKKRQSTEGEAHYAASQLETFRDSIRKGDCILAYKTENYVAMVGKVTGGYGFNTSNELGDPAGPLRYPNQAKVDWFPRPRDFHRSNFYHTSLPELVKWVALRGTVYFRDYPDGVLERVCDEIREIHNGAGKVSRP